jgi:AraC-like DNA-binding protein
MQSLKHFPQPPLSAFVRCLWYWEGESLAHSREKLLPNGEASVIFNLRDEAIKIYDPHNFDRFASYGTAVISGARANSFVIDTLQQERVVGIQFQPGGAYPFFRMPASEMEGISIDLADLWPGRCQEMREKLLAASTIEGMLVDLERSLLDQLVRPLELHPAVAWSLRQFRSSSHPAKIAAVTGEIGMSPRRFVELFRRQVGMAPKTFCRVRRFQRVLQTVHGNRNLDWIDVALHCGYYDQAHFIHDFQSFCGLTPGAYLAAATPHLNHVPLN